MSKLWVVLQDAGDDAEVVGVFDNLEDAAEARLIFPGSRDPEEHELNFLPKHPRGKQRFSVALDKTGKVVRSWRTDPLWPTPSELPVVKRVALGQGIRYAQALSVDIWANNEKEAVEQAKMVARKELDNG